MTTVNWRSMGISCFKRERGVNTCYHLLAGSDLETPAAGALKERWHDGVLKALQWFTPMIRGNLSCNHPSGASKTYMYPHIFPGVQVPCPLFEPLLPFEYIKQPFPLTKLMGHVLTKGPACQENSKLRILLASRTE